MNTNLKSQNYLSLPPVFGKWKIEKQGGSEHWNKCIEQKEKKVLCNQSSHSLSLLICKANENRSKIMSHLFNDWVASPICPAKQGLYCVMVKWNRWYALFSIRDSHIRLLLVCTSFPYRCFSFLFSHLFFTFLFRNALSALKSVTSGRKIIHLWCMSWYYLAAIFNR